jgi:hypothetical protein
MILSRGPFVDGSSDTEKKLRSPLTMLGVLSCGPNCVMTPTAAGSWSPRKEWQRISSIAPNSMPGKEVCRIATASSDCVLKNGLRIKAIVLCAWICGNCSQASPTTCVEFSSRKKLRSRFVTTSLDSAWGRSNCRLTALLASISRKHF